MLQLRFSVEGEDQIVPLSGAEIRFGRSGDNEVVLPDYSVSRRHAALRRKDGDWTIYDLESTNGVEVNGTAVQRARVGPRDRIKIGIFEIVLEDPGLPVDPQAPTAAELEMPADLRDELRERRDAVIGAPAPPPAPAPQPPSTLSSDSALSNATIVRPLAELTADYGLEGPIPSGDSSIVRKIKREALDVAYGTQIFGFLTRLARLLITTAADDEILKHVMEIAFDALPVNRGFILLRDETDAGELRCELVRIDGRVEMRPAGEVPISKTMLEAVMREQVALLTYDALSDQRLAGTESVRIHQIRAAMCAPLWAGEKIIGVMQVDTPHHAGSFTEQDVDLLATLANYCAVALERNRNARDAEFERQMRNRLERYHSPSVIEEILQQDPERGDEAIHRLKKAEVSVLFADIVGFTPFSEKAEPEAVAEILEGYFTHAVEAIFSTGGTLDKFIGDCVMAFFGAPMPQPDHAQRAVAAALHFCAALDEWNAERERRGQTPITTRVGINSGPVVVGDVGSNRRVDYTVLGNTVNVAARLEELAASPGEIVVGAATHRLLGDEVATESLGELRLKGLSQPIVAYRVLRG